MNKSSKYFKEMHYLQLLSYNCHISTQVFKYNALFTTESANHNYEQYNAVFTTQTSCTGTTHQYMRNTLLRLQTGSNQTFHGHANTNLESNISRAVSFTNIKIVCKILKSFTKKHHMQCNTYDTNYIKKSLHIMQITVVNLCSSIPQAELSTFEQKTGHVVLPINCRVDRAAFVWQHGSSAANKLW